MTPGSDVIWHPDSTHKVHQYNRPSAAAAGGGELEARTVKHKRELLSVEQSSLVSVVGSGIFVHNKYVIKPIQ